MHEAGLMARVLEIAARHAEEAGAGRIRLIALRVGALSGVEKESLRFAFEALKPGTPAREAELLIEEVPLRGSCEACNIEFAADGLYGIALCPSCGEPVAAVAAGEELEISYLEVI